MDTIPDSDAMAKTMATVLIHVTPLLEAVAGYRRQAEGHGFSPSVAEEMASSFHEHLLGFLFRS